MGARMPTPDGSALVRDTEDWVRELRALKRGALSRRDAVQAEELQAEIDELTALLDTASQTALTR
jgi:hypothetical protein